MANDGSTIEITARIVAAYVSNNSVRAADLSGLIGSVHDAISTLEQPKKAPVPVTPKPAVRVKDSITPEYIICLDDGRRFRSLKRHLHALGMSPDEYRAKWGLPFDYPMVAPAYAAKRSEFAKKIGLGQMRKKGAPTAGKKPSAKKPAA